MKGEMGGVLYSAYAESPPAVAKAMARHTGELARLSYRYGAMRVRVGSRGSRQKRFELCSGNTELKYKLNFYLK